MLSRSRKGNTSAGRIELEDIRKDFPRTGVTACDGANLVARPGSITALVGQNGAGKSTLMGILAGAIRPDGGKILIDGREQRFNTPADGLKAGIGMVRQHLRIVPGLSVRENIILACEPRRWPGFIDFAAADAMILELCDRYGYTLPLYDTAGRADTFEGELIALTATLYHDVHCVILDEPTASFSDSQVDHYLEVVGMLRDEGKTVFFITHKFDQALRIADEIAVMRNGRIVETLPPESATVDRIFSLMTGATATQSAAIETGRTGNSGIAATDGVRVPEITPVFETRGIGCTIRVSSGEIVAVTGAPGEDLRVLEDALSGFSTSTGGTISLRGGLVAPVNPRNLRRRGVAYVPSDRRRRGSILAAPVFDNLIVHMVHSNRRFGFLQMSDLRSRGRKILDSLDALVSLGQPMETLSGGTIQKVVASREMAGAPAVVLLAEPTYGLDLAAKGALFEMIRRCAADGSGILILGTDLTEFAGLAHRGVIVRDGSNADEFSMVGVEEREIHARQQGVSEVAP
jgi:ABC-type uncharacterized transport system ATPase subunit